MARYINADALKRKAQKAATEAWKMKLTAKVETTLNQFIDWIDEMPTIDHFAEVSKEDLISRKAVYDAAECMRFASDEERRYGFSLLEQIPTAEPEIIRCGDCVLTDGHEPIADGRYWCMLHGAYMYYCSAAERRTDE